VASIHLPIFHYEESASSSLEGAVGALMKMVFGHAAPGRGTKPALPQPSLATLPKGGLDMLLVGLIALGVASFAAMLAFVGFCDWV
jgi:hypothetical protein